MGEWSYVVSFTPATHWIAGWVSLTAGLDAVAKRIIPYPCRE